MAAAEYYLGSEGAQRMHNQSLYPPPQLHQQPQNNLQLQPYGTTPPPSYTPQAPPYPAHSGYQPSPYQQQPPYPTGLPPSASNYPNPYPPQQQSSRLGVPLQPQRSHSQPPRVHFTPDVKGSDSDSSTSSTSSGSSPRRSRHRRRHRHRHHDRDSDLAYGKDYSRDRDHDRSHSSSHHHHHHRHHKERKDRETFLGAGGGAIIGDALFPGLGTAAGMLLGGYGGRKHAERRSRSEIGDSRRRSGSAEGHGHYVPGAHRRAGAGSGWDEESATYKVGHAVR